ncbi:hypothetical protein L3Q82_012893 [Scortum barcoo]|uniref:Uncharacterized protein n=1 Tax=Scortum barcoo TaxID=214431 RepID=A0ACB8W085_9TELE|nr:hypothetical protein L3Q82_012893 [Scortum barcoo]
MEEWAKIPATSSEDDVREQRPHLQRDHDQHRTTLRPVCSLHLFVESTTFIANAPTDFPMSAVLYKTNVDIQLMAHEQQYGEGSDTASNGATLLGQQQPPQHLQRLPAVPHVRTETSYTENQKISNGTAGIMNVTNEKRANTLNRTTQVTLGI